jgi:hypothetical protein
VTRAPLVLRWDLDKTYLVSQFESLRYHIRVPFQKAKDKVALPGVAALIKGVRRCVERDRRPLAVYFLSASPPQIGAAIREKLELDGIAYDGITFKDQVRHLMYARFDAVLEQIGYKLEQLLTTARESASESVELLFGDDWESDPFVYSLYADVVEGRVDEAAVSELLGRAGVSRHYRERILALISVQRASAQGRRLPAMVGGIFILRQRPARAGDLDAFGPRMVWFDNYFECALRLWDLRLLDSDGVFEVLADIGFNPTQTAVSFDAVCERARGDRSRLAPLRRALVGAGVMDPVAPAPLWNRIGTFLQRSVWRAPRALAPGTVPDYARLVERWSYRGRKEAHHEEEDPARRADDGR